MIDRYSTFCERLKEHGIESPERLPTVPPFEGTHVPYIRRIASRIVAEYAAAAPLGTPRDAVFARVIVDYPQLADWLVRSVPAREADPARYPELFVDGKLALEGRSRPPATPRFLGGWNVERAVLGAEGDELALIAELTQYLRIRTRLPLVDWAAKRFGRGEKPFEGRTVLRVSHLLADVALASALRDLGVANGVVRPTARAGRSPPRLSIPDYERQVRQALDDALEDVRGSGRSLLVMDDGGFVASILHGDPKYAPLRAKVRIVEQTTGGIDKAQDVALETPVIEVADSESKRREAEVVGRVVSGKVAHALARLGGDLKGKEVAVVGYGNIGKAVAAELLALGARVVVCESGADKRAQIRACYRAASLEEAAATIDGAVVATAGTSVELAHLRKMKSGTFVAAAGSKRAGIAVADLIKSAAARRDLDTGNPLITLPNVEYTLGGKRLVVIGDGYPCNFDGDVETCPPEQVQLTIAAMLAGLFRAAQGNDRPGFAKLDPAIDRELMAKYDELVAGKSYAAVEHPHVQALADEPQ